MSAPQLGFAPKMKPLLPKRSALIAALDVGTSKVACLIARLRPHPPGDAFRRRSHSIEVLGLGHTSARGMKAGAVIDLAAAEAAIRQAVDLAERAAKMQLEAVMISVSAGRLGSELMSASVDVAGKTVADGDIARVLSAGSRHSARPGRVVLHSLPIGYALDDAKCIRDPRGMLGRRFGIDMHVASADVFVVRNLMLAIERCHLGIEALVAGPYVAGLSALADDEADLGAAVIDMGGGTTSIAVFAGGRFIHLDGFTLGGGHVTMDLARGLNASLADAERIKTLYGSVLAGGADERNMITIPSVGQDERDTPQFFPRSSLIRIIKPRIEEILEMVLRVACSIGRSVSGVHSAFPDCRTRRKARPLPLPRACLCTRRRRIWSISNRSERGIWRQEQAATSHGSDDGFGKASDDSTTKLPSAGGGPARPAA